MDRLWTICLRSSKIIILIVSLSLLVSGRLFSSCEQPSVHNRNDLNGVSPAGRCWPGIIWAIMKLKR